MADTHDSEYRLTKFEDIRNGAVMRQFKVARQGIERPSSITWYIICPFYDDLVKAYLRSLSGAGKRCKCGAIFGSGGTAYKIPHVVKPTPVTQADFAEENEMADSAHAEWLKEEEE